MNTIELLAYYGLKKDQSIDYKSASEQRTSIGKILDFKMAPKTEDSLWMLVQDAASAETQEWISCAVWREQTELGIFKNHNNDANTQRPDDGERPF